MDRRVAEQLMKAFFDLSEPLNAATSLTSQIDGKEEQAAFRKGIGEIMNIAYVDLMRPIIRQYPDLDPDAKTGAH